MFHAFVCYSRDDQDRAFGLKGRLQDEFIETYIDPALKPGDDWRSKLKQALDSSYALVVICTKSAMDPHEVTCEWAYAMSLEIPVIPVVFEKGLELHSRLSTLQHIDFSDVRQRNWDKLFQALNDAKRKYQPTRSFLRQAGITHISFSRNELGTEYSIHRILERIGNDSEVLVVARSCEAWAREYIEIQNTINTKNTRMRLTMVNPKIPKEQWLIPSDYAQLDVTASVGKLAMITVEPSSTGYLELVYLPSSPLFSFVYFSEDKTKHVGILEAGASLPLSERMIFVFNSDGTQGIALQRIHKIYRRVLDEGETVLKISSQK